jgi:hypothetical protein
VILFAAPPGARADPQPTTTSVEETTTTHEPPPKAAVCKYVGKPGVDERLQTGQNPIVVSFNALPLPLPIIVGSEFADAQGRSIVIAIVHHGDPEPGIGDCPAPVGPPPPPPATTTTEPGCGLICPTTTVEDTTTTCADCTPNTLVGPTTTAGGGGGGGGTGSTTTAAAGPTTTTCPTCGPTQQSLPGTDGSTTTVAGVLPGTNGTTTTVASSTTAVQNSSTGNSLPLSGVDIRIPIALGLILFGTGALFICAKHFNWPLPKGL